ncbi:MAG: endonuclease/exonuclease/phosphatase family protein [Prevotella sp.]|nr:endonuclease/exonuclease/phosphatase family protein [Prevotella sp.]
MKTTKKVFYSALVTINVFVIIAMIVTGYSYLVPPQQHATLSTLGLLFPVTVISDLAMLVVWMLFKFRGILIPIAGLAICYPPIHSYLPLNVSTRHPEGSIKVMSYNVYLFAPWDKKDKSGNKIIEYISHSGADIICLQESSTHELNEQGKQLLESSMEHLYPYQDTLRRKRANDVLTIYSKFPIIGKERINYESTNNQSGAFFLNINGEEVIVINNHFESNKLKAAERDGFNDMMHGNLNKEESKAETLKLLATLNRSARLRGPQADSVAAFIRAHSNKSIILCGDFNDTPISYTHWRIAGELDDCYITSGNGPGFSYDRGSMHVRIDNIMCSSDWTPYECHIDRKITQSDHYPVVCWLKKADKH